jgi:hypothetical protein
MTTDQELNVLRAETSAVITALVLLLEREAGLPLRESLRSVLQQGAALATEIEPKLIPAFLEALAPIDKEMIV